jgi:RHS repeat-associated protein
MAEYAKETRYSYFGARYYDSELSVWLSVDPMASMYPSLSSFAYCTNNPLSVIDPDGRKIRPVNKKAEAAIISCSEKYGQLLIIPNPTRENIYTTERYFATIKEFNKAFKAELKRPGTTVTKKDKPEAWAFYNALSDSKVFEVSVFETSEKTSSDYSNDYSEAQREGSKLIGDGILTDNIEYDEFIEILKSTGGVVYKDIAEILYNGGEFRTTDGSYSITSDVRGDGWVYFKDKTSIKVNGHLVIDGTGKDNNSISNILISIINLIRN